MKKQDEIHSYLSFKLGDEVFAANVSKVINILEMSKITKVPKSPSYMKGVINLRGVVLPLLDARMKFGMEEKQYTTNTCILVLSLDVENNKVMLGAIVDSVQEVIEINTSELVPSPQIGNTYKSEFITGVYSRGDEFIMILDMEKLVITDELITQNELNKELV